MSYRQIYQRSHETHGIGRVTKFGNQLLHVGGDGEKYLFPLTVFQLTILYTGSRQRYNGGPKGTILFAGFSGTTSLKAHCISMGAVSGMNSRLLGMCFGNRRLICLLAV